MRRSHSLRAAFVVDVQRRLPSAVIALPISADGLAEIIGRAARHQGGPAPACYPARRAVSSAGQSASLTPRRSGVRAPHRPPPVPRCYDAARQPPSARSTTRMPLWLIILLIAVAV